jgi:hypothetical protein
VPTRLKRFADGALHARHRHVEASHDAIVTVHPRRRRRAQISEPGGGVPGAGDGDNSMPVRAAGS